MTHPFPKNIPLLRRIYAGRFSKVRFILPFERSTEDDVITVYRGSYVHAAYITDARARLRSLDCDYYMMVQDDVLLNPGISEYTFFEFFNLAEREGFVARAGPLSKNVGDWIWYYGFIARLFFPKSILFGSGIELSNLIKYLPSAADLREALERSGMEATHEVRFDPGDMAGIAADGATRLLLHGLAAQLGGSARQGECEALGLGIARDLIAVMLAAQRTGTDTAQSQFPLPVPIVASGYHTDFYIVPRSGFDDFCHYMGVAGAANLFVEISAPTALVASCERVRRAAELGLDCDGFDMAKRPDWFLNDRTLGIHPFKLSAIDTPDRQDAFVQMLSAIRDGQMPDARLVARAGIGLPLEAIIRGGWNPPERWGTWAAAREAELEIPLVEPARLQLKLHAPLHPRFPVQEGRLLFHGGSDSIAFAAEWPSPDITVEIPELRPDSDGFARVTLLSDHLIVPAELQEGSPDTRVLGFALTGADWGDGRAIAGSVVLDG